MASEMSALRRSGFFLAVLVAAASVVAASLEASTLSKRIDKDTITVAAEGVSPRERFALVFSRQAASIVGWYDLARDPKTEVNLCARGGTNGSALFQNRAEAVVGGKEIVIFPGPAEEFTVVESSDVRIVVRMEGRFTTPTGEFPDEKIRKEVLSFTGSDWKGPERPRYSTRFTVYPTGRIFIRHLWEVKGLPLILKTNRMILGTAPAQDVVALNDYPDSRQAFLQPASFILHHGRNAGFTGSALLVVNYRKYPTDWLGNLLAEGGQRRGWVRSAFTVQSERQLLPPGKYVWHFMLQIEPSNVDSRETAGLYALDYLEAARIRFVNSQGCADLNETEDEQLDGFSEGRGAYVMSAMGKAYVAMQMDTAMHSRCYPAFEIRDWKGGIPRFITVDENRRRAGVHYNVHLAGGTLVMQYLGVLSPGTHSLEVGEFAAEEGAKN
jgi:hypothetical protein